MTLPPQLIKLKRKRDEAPIETLVLQREGNDGSAGQDIGPSVKFKRIRNEENFPDPALPKSADADRSGISAELFPSKAPTAASRNGATGGQPAAGISAPTSPQHQDQKPQHADAAAESPLRPRRIFHLSKERSTSGLRRSTSATSLRGIHKRRKPARGGIAVFEQRRPALEKIYSAADSRAASSTVVAHQPSRDGLSSEQGRDYAATSPAHAHKRPGASSAERQWREKTWSKSATANAAAQDTYIEAPDANDTFLALAAELQEFAMQESEKDAATTVGAETSAPASVSHPPVHHSIRPAKPLKYLPKAPPLRYHERHPETLSQSMLDEESESEWVYDTYIREIHDGSSKSPDDMIIDLVQPADAKLAAAASSIGYLVIRAEDEDIWEEFMSDGESSDEEKWGEDEEDENAEDYHGNDYPEDEAWSGSGYGSGSNSYDSQGDEWSDEGENKSGGD